MADPSKTEKATPKRRQDERKKGHVFLSQDAVSTATLVGTWSLLCILAATIVEELSAFINYCFRQVGTANVLSELAEIQRLGIGALLKAAGPLLLMTAVLAVAATLLQTRFLISGEIIRPKFSKINPLEGFKRLFSLKSVINALKGVLKIIVLLVIVFNNLKKVVQECIKYPFTDIESAIIHFTDACGTMMIQLIIAFIVLSAADYLYQKWEYERDMRMSKQEIKEEFKQTEGDPKVKGRIREIQRQRAQMRMMQQVPQADVVIKNPTHFAVALRYKPEQDNAPIVLAKGQDALALRIISVAEEHQVTVVENIPLARALYAQTELNREIPPELYNAVAEVLVYIFKLDENRRIIK